MLMRISIGAQACRWRGGGNDPLQTIPEIEASSAACGTRIPALSKSSNGMDRLLPPKQST